MANYTSINVTPPAAAGLRSFAAQATGRLGRRVTMTDALRLATLVATGRPESDLIDAAVTLGLLEPPAGDAG